MPGSAQRKGWRCRAAPPWRRGISRPRNEMRSTADSLGRLSPARRIASCGSTDDGAGALALNAGQAAGRNRAARQVSLTSETGGPRPPNFLSRTRNGAIGQERSSRAARGVMLIVEVPSPFGSVMTAKETVQGRNSGMSDFTAETFKPFRSLRQFHLLPRPPHRCAPVPRGPEAA